MAPMAARPAFWRETGGQDLATGFRTQQLAYADASNVEAPIT